MKISGRQLEMVLRKLQYAMIGYRSDEKDFEIEIGLTKEDPGNGVMVDCLTLKSTKVDEADTETDKVETMTVEVYPSSEKLDPRASKTESFKITDKNRY